VEHARRQTLRHHFGRGAGSRRDENLQVWASGAESVHERQQRKAFADTGAVQPGELSVRARQAAAPEPFAEAFGIFLAAPGSALKESWRERRDEA